MGYFPAIAIILMVLAPSNADLDRFPPRSEVLAARSFNRAYAATLSARQGLDPSHWWDYQAALGDVNSRYVAWDCLDDAQLARAPSCQREHLCRLRDLLGPVAYYAGRMPDPCDFLRFTEIK